MGIVTDLAVKTSWNVASGFKNTFTITVTEGGSAYSLASRAFSLQIRKIGSETNFVNLTEGSGITNGGATGILTIVLTAAQSATLGNENYLWQLTCITDETRWLSGTVEATTGVYDGDTATALSASVSLTGTALTLAITLASTTASGITFTPAANIAATNVQSAIEEVVSDLTTIANAKVADAINDGTTTIAPSQNAVFDALALKQDTLSTASFAEMLTGTNNTKLVTPLRVRSVTERVYNVEAYGAVHDGVTDDTAAIQASITACASAGGGVVYFPNGVYVIGGALITSLNSVNPNCQLYVPLQNAATVGATLVTVKLMGEEPPITYFNHLETTANPPLTGAVLKSTVLGSGTLPAVIGTSWIASPFSGYDADFNFTKIEIENLTIRTRSITAAVHVAPTMTGINLYRYFAAEVRHVRVDTESRILDQSVLPTSVQSVGIRMPRWNNQGVANIEDVLVQCYYTGIILDECSRGDKLFVGACVEGFNIGGDESTAANYPIVIGRVFAHANITALRVQAPLRYHIESFNVEDYQGFRGAKWFNGVNDVSITSATAIGSVQQVIVGVAGTGARAFSNAGSNAAQLKVYRDLYYSFFDRLDVIKNLDDFPKTISRMVAWWDFTGFSKISSGPITAFVDKSGSGYNTAEATNRPTYTVGGTNGNASAVFDGTNDVQSRTALAEIQGVAAFTLVYVGNKMAFMQDNGVSTARTGLVWASNVYYAIVSNAGTSYGSFVDTSASTAIYVIIYDGSLSGNANRLKAYKNDATQSLTFVGTIPATTENSGTLFKFGKDDSGAFYAGNLYECLVFDKALTTTEKTNLYNFLKIKYGL